MPIPVRGAARFLEELTGHMDTHPDALTSGDSRCPPVLLRLTHVLHDAGHPVVRPGCAHCGKTGHQPSAASARGPDLRHLRRASRRRRTCARCGRTTARIAARRAEGANLSPLLPRRPASRSRSAPLRALRTRWCDADDGARAVHQAVKRPMHTCVRCGKTAARRPR